MPDQRKVRQLEYFRPEPPKRPVRVDFPGSGWVMLLSGTLMTTLLLLGLWSQVFSYLTEPIRVWSWERLPCTVVAADAKRVPVKGGTAMDLDLKYTYQFRGVPHVGSRYSFGHPLGEAQTRQLLRQLPPRTTLSCLVNPADPTEAVIDPHLSRGAWAAVLVTPFFLVPYLFAYVGVMRIRDARLKRRLGPTADSGSTTEIFLLPIIPLTLLAVLMLYIDIVAQAGVLGWLLTIIVGFVDSLLIALMVVLVVWSRRRNRPSPPPAPSPTSG